MSAEIKITVDNKEVIAAFNGLRAGMSDLSPVMKFIAGELLAVHPRVCGEHVAAHIAPLVRPSATAMSWRVSP